MMRVYFILLIFATVQVLSLTSEDIVQSSLEQGLPLLIFVTLKGCQACIQAEPYWLEAIDALSVIAEDSKVSIPRTVVLSASENKIMIKKLGVDKFPTFLRLEGNKLWSLSGVQDVSNIVEHAIKGIGNPSINIDNTKKLSFEDVMEFIYNGFNETVANLHDYFLNIINFLEVVYYRNAYRLPDRINKIIENQLVNKDVKIKLVNFATTALVLITISLFTLYLQSVCSIGLCFPELMEEVNTELKL